MLAKRGLERSRRSVVVALGASLTLGLLGAGLLGAGAGAGWAQSGTGTVTGRVVWCAGVAFPAVLAPDAEGSSASMPPSAPLTPPDAGQDQMPSLAPGGVPIRPLPRALPAGAVLVAAQGTQASTRTDENGRFTLSGVPAGTYLTLAAGPVAVAGQAYALRPNVQVAAGQTVDLGLLGLGGTNGVCRVLAVGGPVPMAGTDADPGMATDGTEP